MNIAVFSAKPYDREFFDRTNAGHHTLTYFDAALTRDTANLTQGFEGVCIFVNDKADEPCLQKMAGYGVKVIVLRCAGFNNVDLAAAKAHNINVYRVPAYSPESVAEHAVALIMTLNRKTHKAYNRVRENNFSLERLTGFNLHGKTVGIIGTGQIGIAFGRIMKGFGCKLAAYDVVQSETFLQLGGNYYTLHQLLQQSDIISLHCPLNDHTRKLINKDAFAHMKRGAMLINTSRGAVINTHDAVHALKSGQLGYLGIDVYEQEEKLFFNDLSESIIQDDLIARLMTFPNVLITAHQGFFTTEALTEIAQTTLQNLHSFTTQTPTPNELTRTV